MIRIVLHSSAPGYSVSFSLSEPFCPGVNPNTNPNPLLFLRRVFKLSSQILNQVRLGYFRFCQIMLNYVGLRQGMSGQGRLVQVRLVQFRIGQVRLGQVRLGQDRLGQVRLDLVRFKKNDQKIYFLTRFLLYLSLNNFCESQVERSIGMFGIGSNFLKKRNILSWLTKKGS